MDTVLQWLSSALALLPAGLIAGVGIGAGAEAVKWLKESSLRRRGQHDAGAAAALELVPLLTKFARECNSLWCYNEYEPYYYNMPKLPAFPDNLTWTSLPQKTAGAIRALPNEIEAAENAINFEEHTPRQRCESASEFYILVGYRAAQLADDLRHHFDQGRYKSTTEYDFQSNLRRQHRHLYRGRLRRSRYYVWCSRSVSRRKRRPRRVV
jgi:hypothetical protein